MYTLEDIPSLKSATKQKRRRAYRRKRPSSLKSSHFRCPHFQCGPPAVEPQSDFTYCESTNSDSDLTDYFLITSSKEGGVTDLNALFDSVTPSSEISPKYHRI